jgi:Flp pilus assembly protein TadD
MTDYCTSDGDYTRGELEQLRRWSALTPTDAEARMALARKLLHYGKADEAILEVRAVIAMAPNHLEARKLLESAHALLGRTSN